MIIAPTSDNSVRDIWRLVCRNLGLWNWEWLSCTNKWCSYPSRTTRDVPRI